MSQNRGFTLMEIMIVVAIIALVSAVALPSFMRARRSAQSAKFTNALHIAGDAIETYAAENGNYPADVARGVVPPGMVSYLDDTLRWTENTPIGGQWDWDFNVFGVRAAVSVVGATLDVMQLQEIDEKFDDGNLAIGRFRTLGANRYGSIVEN